MPEIIIIAGPNGAGKTSFANEYFPFAREGLLFVNADEIAREITKTDLTSTTIDMKAGRQMLRLIDSLVSEGEEFMFETTLATLSRAKNSDLATTWLPRLTHFPQVAEHRSAIERVARRVRSGGHNIPELVVRQRFEKGRRYLDEIYKPLVNDWSVWDSFEGNFQVAEMWDD